MANFGRLFLGSIEVNACKCSCCSTFRDLSDLRTAVPLLPKEVRNHWQASRQNVDQNVLTKICQHLPNLIEFAKCSPDVPKMQPKFEKTQVQLIRSPAKVRIVEPRPLEDRTEVPLGHLEVFLLALRRSPLSCLVPQITTRKASMKISEKIQEPCRIKHNLRNSEKKNTC